MLRRINRHSPWIFASFFYPAIARIEGGHQKKGLQIQSVHLEKPAGTMNFPWFSRHYLFNSRWYSHGIFGVSSFKNLPSREIFFERAFERAVLRLSMKWHAPGWWTPLKTSPNLLYLWTNLHYTRLVLDNTNPTPHYLLIPFIDGIRHFNYYKAIYTILNTYFHT